MRVLHTSDWHLGRLFHGASLLADQERALARVAAIARERAVDVVVVAGDLYDRAIPPADAVDLLAQVLQELRAGGAQVVAITGNHDSPNRVGALDPLLRAGGVTLRGRFDAAAPVVVPATDGGPDLVVHPVPYLEPLAAPLVPRAGGRPRRATQHEVLGRALDAVRAELAERGPVRSVVVAHAFVAGAAPSDSERELSVGEVDRVPTSVFDGVTYTALGHLHRPQEVGPRAAYSGSLLPYSFSETSPSSVRVVELAADGSIEAEVVALGCERPVATIEGRLDALLSDPAHRAAEGAWVRARLRDEVLPRHAMARLRDRFPHTLMLEHVRPAAIAPAADPRRRSGPVTDLDLVGAFLAERFGRPAEGAETALLEAAFAAVATAEPERVPVPVAAASDGAEDDTSAWGAA
ncbi:MAG TPA: exonuclease SbcCD subunit D [Iamia sp.]|nr:exonuclease SbcCD subunit D [Iamia sp.]